MGMALELTTGFATAPGATPIAATIAAGNSLQVKNATPESRILLLNFWSDHQVAGIVQLRSPKLHDNVRGIRYRSNISEVQPYMPRLSKQPLYAQDVLVLEIAGSAVGGDIETACYLSWYENLPGVEGRFLSPEEVARRGVNTVTVETTHAAGAAGGYSGQVALNSGSDLLIANVDYALLGYVVNAECAAVRLLGPDTGNTGVGGPGSETDKHMTRHWFGDISQAYGLPLCPVINAANKAATLCDVATDENAGTFIVSWTFVQLAPR